LNKKLSLLENLESDHDGDSNGDGNDDDTGRTFRILQEVADYLGAKSSDRGRENVSGALLETPL